MRLHVASALPGYISQAFTHPLDSLLTLNVTLAPTASLFSVISSLSTRSTLEGAGFLTRTFPILSALYSGLPITILGAICYRAIYISLYDSTFRLLDTVKDRKNRKYAGIAHSFIVTSLAASLTYPFDTIRRVQNIMSLQGQESSIFDSINLIWSTTGIRGFLEGNDANILRQAASVLVFLAIESK